MTAGSLRSGERAARSGGGSLFAIGGGLLLLFVVVLSLASQAARPQPSPDEVLEGWIEAANMPFGLEPTGATRSKRALFATFTSPAAADEAPKPESPTGSAGSKPEGEPFDWSAVPVGATGHAPIELLVARYGQGGLEWVEQLFEPPSRERGERVEVEAFDSNGGTATMDRGRLRWGAYDVAFVHERHLEPGGTFRDVVRCNLSLPGRPLVVYARWPRGFPASKERLGEVLAALRPI